MRCKQCGNELVRGFSFCLECGLPVPDEMLEESGLPQRNIDSGPKTSGVGETAERIEDDPAARQTDVIAEAEEPGDLKPQLLGGSEEDRGAALKPQLIGGDAGIGGKDLKPKLMGLGEEIAGKALKPQYIGGDDDKGTGEQVKVVLQETSSETDNVTEKLVFCPNCGMRMQHNPNICDVCGMLLGNKPTNVPKSPSGVPLFNTDGDAFAGGFGTGFGGFGSGLEGSSGEDASRIDNLIGGNNDPMFNTSSPADNLAALSEQLAGFSAAAGMRSIEATENTRIRQTEPDKGMEREVSDFSMIDDLSSESVPMSDEGMPVVGDYSMEEDPDAFVDLDPYGFVGMSMDETPDEPFVKKSSGLGASSAAFEPRKAPDPEPISEAPVPETNDRGPESIAPPTVTIGKQSEVIEAETEKETAVSESSPEAQNSEAPEAAVQAANTVEQPSVKQEAPRASATKKCHACGHIMPATDKFCPNCGRSTFGAPNPNLINRASANTPAPKKRSVFPFILILLLAVAAAVFVTMYIMKQNTEASSTVESEQLTVDIEDSPSEA